jgi:hypothetical protein
MTVSLVMCEAATDFLQGLVLITKAWICSNSSPGESNRLCKCSAQEILKWVPVASLSKTGSEELPSKLQCIPADRNSSVGVATGCELNGSGIEFQSREDLLHPSRRPWAPITLLYDGYRFSFLTVECPGRAVDSLPPSSTEVVAKLELCLYTPCGPLFPVLGWTLYFTFLAGCTSQCYWW